jgi:hypothetical protein
VESSASLEPGTRPIEDLGSQVSTEPSARVEVDAVTRPIEDAGPRVSTEPSARVEVDAVMRQLELGTRPIEGPGVHTRSGWKLRLPSGRMVNRSQLQDEARYLAALGAEAVPALADWANHASAAINFVAMDALRQITGISPPVLYFDDANRDGGRTRAIAAWRDWYARRPR